MHRCESDKPAVGNRKFGGRSGGGQNGMERERPVFFFTGHRSLLGVVRDTLSTILRRESAAVHAPAGVLSSHSSAKRGERGMGINKRWF